MGMLNWLRDPWGHRNRVKQLEACNARLAKWSEQFEAERNEARLDLRDADRDLKLAIAERDAVVRQAEAAEQAALKINAKLLGDIDQLTAERDNLKAERDATAKSLEETTASLIDAKRRHGHLLDEFDRLAGMFRKKLADLHAAEELLDEAGDEIDTLRWTRNMAVDLLGERSVKLDRIAEIARR